MSEPETTPPAPEPPQQTLWADLVAVVRGGRHDYTSAPLGRSILLLAVPMVLETSMQSIFAVCDTYFVGKLGAAAVASVGITEAMLSVIFAMGFGLAIGTTALVARRVGEKNDEGASVAAAQSLFLGLGLSLVLGVAGGLGAPRLLALMGADDDVLEIGVGYAQWMLGGSATILLLFLINAIFRGSGDPMLALKALTLANLLNIALDPILIFGLGPIPAMGVTGAAVATNLARGIGIFYQLWVLTQGSGRVRLAGHHLKIVGEVVVRLLNLSGFAVFQMFVATTSFTAMMRILTPYSSDAVAGYTIAIRLIVFVLLPAWGLSNAAATLVGQNLGAKKPERAERAVYVTGLYNMGFLVTVAVLFFTLSRMLVGFFTAEPTVIEIGAECLRIISFGYLFMAWGMILMQAFNGAGDTRTPTWISLGCHWFLKLPVAYVLTWPLGWGPKGIFVAIALAEVAVAVTAVILFRGGRWKRRAV